ncbi:hypothetical protein OESDEN_01806 [Oesophagostomum dentatum]|uniref:Otopetrin n=1 Tax=Oesophagostomum dentatum TaxID=61180 RepID=A0A0B1TQ46_OESDE|nr:hypothetical protein OESDEN_01806 [Oesophagostomum dentatum]
MVYHLDTASIKEGQPYYEDVAAPRTPVVIIPDDFEDSKDYTDIASPRGLIEDPRIATPWIRNKKAATFFINLLTCLYALILTIVAFIIEVSPTWRGDIWLAETIFFIFMYGIGIIFFIYCYLFIIHPEAYNFIIGRLTKMKIIRIPHKWIIQKTNHTGEGAGTLYLRLGALFFGSAGIVLFGLEMFLCIENRTCMKSAIAKHVVAMVFTFIQMHFIFCNSKVAIESCLVGKLGMMHLVSVNLWTWFRFVLAKTAQKAAKKMSYHATSASSSSSSEESEAREDHGLLTNAINSTLAVLLETTTASRLDPQTMMKQSLGAMSQFGDVATFLTTCIVEYSLIGAAVMFIQWKSIGYSSGHHHSEEKLKRKQKMRIDCSSSSTGLFAGIIFLIAAFVSMGMYTIFEELRNSRGAQLLFGIVDLCMFSMTLGACLLGLWRMGVLQYRLHAHGEVIDEILLIIGLVGEIVYCVVGLDIFVTNRRAHTDRSILPAFVFVVRLVQVVVQAAFILITSRLRCLSPYALKYKPGKEIITFLLVANVTLFVFHTYEGMKSSFGIGDYGGTIYKNLIYAVAPLLVFYRFHSSACLAEIWKHTYSTKSHGHNSRSSTMTDSSLTLETTAERRPSHSRLHSAMA